MTVIITDKTFPTVFADFFI